uniref:Uncharacterized protein n=1 Tax=Plectus sambesii TaxID=2011161 RepID=A0A914VPP7_9BILA
MSEQTTRPACGDRGRAASATVWAPASSDGGAHSYRRWKLLHRSGRAQKRCPLTEGDLHVLASAAAAQNNTNEEFSSLLPRNHFQRTYDLMQILLNEDADGNLILINNATSDVVAKTYFKVPATKKAMLSSLADFCGRMLETASVEDFARYASISMNCRIMTADWIQLHDLLCRIENLEKSIESNMIDAFEVFADAAIEGLDTASKKTKSKNAWSIPIKDLRAVKRFIGEKKEFLKRYPKLLIQEVANYPQSSGVQEILYSNSMTDPVIQWQNKPDQASKCLRTVKYGDTAVTAATVSLNGAVLAFGDEEGLVRIVKYDSAEMVHSFSGHSQRVTDMCFTDSIGQTLVSASADSSLMVWDTVACARLATLHHGDSVVSACRYFEWSKCVLSAGWNGMVRAFAPVMGQWKTASVLDRELSVGSAINCLDCHPTRPVIVVGCWDATLKLYQLAPVKRLAVMRGHVSAVRTAQFVAMGKQIISTGMDGDIRVWATDHGVQVGMFAGHTLPVRAMIPLANDIVTVSEDTTIKVWSSSLGVPLFRQSTDDKATSISLSVDCGLLAVGFGSGVISLFKTQSTDRCVWSHHVDSAVASVRFFGQLIV